MRVSDRWLRELLPALEAPPSEVAARLTAAGLEVEALEHFGEASRQVVVARVTGVDPHPKRSSLTLVTVELAGGRTERVVCGAPNVPAPGGAVAFAPLGTWLPVAGLKLEPREIGGVASRGMLVSEAELGLADTSDGIIVMPGDVAPLGTTLDQALPGSSDVIYTVGVTPNRPDALGHVGVARELAALFDSSFAFPEPGRPARFADAALSSLVTVENRDLERCPHYGASVVLDVRVGPSPDWLRWRLTGLGVRPISNVVDVTNLILLEFGHPMHAFDLDRVRGARVVVRRARAGEPFTTLDGVARKLDADDLVICDGEGPSALAGVMGGKYSEIADTTRRVLLECAYFAPRGIRRTARRHGLHTESSFRFERGVDYGALPRVLDHAQAHLTELAGGAAVRGAIHAKGALPELPRVRLRSKRLDALLGVAVPFSEARATLARLGLDVGPARKQDEDEIADVGGATWRPDIAREADLIEEVARVRGLDAIPTVLPAIAPQPPRTSGQLEREVLRHATSLGLSEALTYAFVSPRELENLHAPSPAVVLKNPLSEERSVMRTSLLPGLLEAVGRARRRGERALGLFAVGARFFDPNRAEPNAAARAARPALASDRGVLPEERPSFAALLAGPRPAYLERPADVDVYDAKGIALELVERLTRRRAAAHHAANDRTRHLHPRGSAEVLVDDELVGVFGPLHPEVVDAFDLDGPAQAIELDLAAIERIGCATPRFQPVPRLPAVTRDLALVVSDDVAAGDVAAEIVSAAGELCESVTLFDLFRGGAVPAEHRSLAFHVVYRDPKAAADPEHARTLTDKEVDARHADVVRAVTERFSAKLRA
jgi:phenylalanyl-tRNA synthetase beta chain